MSAQEDEESIANEQKCKKNNSLSVFGCVSFTHKLSVCPFPHETVGRTVKRMHFIILLLLLLSKTKQQICMPEKSYPKRKVVLHSSCLFQSKGKLNFTRMPDSHTHMKPPLFSSKINGLTHKLSFLV